ncbi:SH3-like domain-containing protein [Pikeienuella sp. HZG-20]|uniref:SH3-like domain-containing protein n=1 Tax=Paludibacillus litoralis TaxID=3133267 RepID=UPI0030EF9BEE
MTKTYRVGQAVRLLHLAPPGHVRAPWYLRGKTGVIERDLGRTGDPEALAYGRFDAPKKRLYRVRFSMGDVWGEKAERPGDRVDAEIFENWLEPADAA